MSFDDFLHNLFKKAERFDQIVLKDIDLCINSLKGEILPVLEKIKLLERNNALKEFVLFNENNPTLEPKSFNSIEEIIFRRSNGNEVRIGGDCAPPFISFLSNNNTIRGLNPNPPKVTFDVFDMKISLPKTIKNHYKEVLDDPAGWAELAVKYGADMVTLHFVSSDPGVMDCPVSKSREILDEVLQRVNVPIIIGGSGNKKKDTLLFEELGSMTAGERLMLSSADKITWDKVVPIARRYGHNVLLWAQLDINDQQKLVEDALSVGMPRDRIVLDPTCATLGYGLEYSYTIFQKIRLEGLSGNKILNFPISGGTTNAWGAREAWMKKINHVPNGGGDRELRGPLWETITALTMSLVGLNLAMMLHPYSGMLFKQFIDDFYSEIKEEIKNDDYLSWVSSNY